MVDWFPSFDWHGHVEFRTESIEAHQPVVLDGTHGNVAVSTEKLARKRELPDRSSYSISKPGQGKHLFVDNVSVMCWDPFEDRTTLKGIQAAHGKVVICGLGLGILAARIRAQEAVKEVVVVEKEIGVIELVGPYTTGFKLVHADFWDYDWDCDYLMVDDLPYFAAEHPETNRLKDLYGQDFWAWDKAHA